jgi:hypothetical protein
MGYCKRKGVECGCLTDHSICNTDNCHRKLPDISSNNQLQKLLQKEDEYYTLCMLIDELYAREKSNNSVHQDLHGTSWVDLIDMAIILLQKIKNPE